MTGKNVSFQDLYSSIDALRVETSKRFDTLDYKIDNKYVTRMEFEPVKRIVYGMVSLIMTIVLSGLVYILIKQ